MALNELRKVKLNLDNMLIEKSKNEKTKKSKGKGKAKLRVDDNDMVSRRVVNVETSVLYFLSNFSTSFRCTMSIRRTPSTITMISCKGRKND